jgi:hypothetical protein
MRAEDWEEIADGCGHTVIGRLVAATFAAGQLNRPDLHLLAD